MTDILLDAEVLEYKEINGNKVLTAKGNPYVSRNIYLDELVSATQMAIYHFTNSGIIEKRYYSTTVLSTKTVLRQAGLWDNLYKTRGFYEETEYNINAVYDYLIQLTAPLRMETLVHYVRVEDNVLYVRLNREVDERSNLKIEVYHRGSLVKEFVVDNSLEYSMDMGDFSIEDIVVKTVGVEFVLRDIYVFEGVNGKDTTQTLIGISSNLVEVSNESNIQGLDILKSASKNTVRIGEQFDYKIKVSNSSDITVDGIIVEDEISKDLKILETDGQVSSNHVSWKVSLQPKEEKILTVHVELQDYMDDDQIKNKATLLFGGLRKDSNEVVVNLTGNKDFIENPQTGTSFPFVEIIGIFCGIVVLFYFTKKKTKLFHIK